MVVGCLINHNELLESTVLIQYAHIVTEKIRPQCEKKVGIALFY
jgi:hypothetical protein